MKKIIASALSLIVGVFGYTIADKELSTRVDNLEASVSSMQEEIDILQSSKTTFSPTLGELSTQDFNPPSIPTPDDVDTTIPKTPTTTIDFRDGYNYGYLKIKLPTFENKKAELFQSDSSYGAYMSSYSNWVTLDGSETSILIYVKNNSTGTLFLDLRVSGVYGCYDYCKCTITEKDGSIYLDDITYYDLSGLTTTTTTTTRIIGEVTTN